MRYYQGVSIIISTKSWELPIFRYFLNLVNTLLGMIGYEPFLCSKRTYKMHLFTFARVIHVLAVVIWIGGVAMVTSVVLPAVRKMKSKNDKIDTFEKIEGKFSLQAKITTILTAITGFYMVNELDAWNRYFELKYWWVTAMTAVWILFSLVLFILEPFVLSHLYRKFATKDPDTTFTIIQRFHWLLLLISLITIFGAVAGSHGWFLFS